MPAIATPPIRLQIRILMVIYPSSSFPSRLVIARIKEMLPAQERAPLAPGTFTNSGVPIETDKAMVASIAMSNHKT